MGQVDAIVRHQRPHSGLRFVELVRVSLASLKLAPGGMISEGSRLCGLRVVRQFVTGRRSKEADHILGCDPLLIGCQLDDRRLFNCDEYAKTAKSTEQ
ncbi:hypothetical protein N7492_003800 [Penicillium capsulatum]|uniref:Uncharacterized protein n=1 Tax=Penicillium capsulatum TaxID=69766 RepID=A0A9W9IL89_9EURO|nr:hypothetical protein N7492_003800 [Penicillium capsulatum]KAJ6121616.1 hypothetical protein N7512_004081 [Penicillium capsulatum]